MRTLRLPSVSGCIRFLIGEGHERIKWVGEDSIPYRISTVEGPKSIFLASRYRESYVFTASLGPNYGHKKDLGIQGALRIYA